MNKLILKNTVISTILIYIFSMVPGWKVDGLMKLAACIMLIVLLSLIATFIDCEIMDR